MNPDRIVNVRLYGRQIGTLTLLATDQNFFAFDEDYINDPGRPTLSLSFKSSQGRLLTDLKPSRTRLPPFFSNLLPEGPLREYLARKAGVSDKREFFLIKELGQDLPGAVTIEESMFATSPGDKNIEFDKQMNSSKRTLRFSLAGVQLKFSAVEGAQGGLTIPVEGKGGYWIVKLPSMTYQAVPENEFYMMRLAGDIGMNVPESPPTFPDAIAPPFFTASISRASAAVEPGRPICFTPMASIILATESPVTVVGAREMSTLPKSTFIN